MSADATSTAATAPATLDWGRTRYVEALRAQEALVARRIAGEISDTLVFTEHEPVFTVGLRAGASTHLVWSADRLAREGVEVVPTNRGGDITYHGPGQIVGYPIVSLASRKDLHAYLRFLEQVLINSLDHLGLPDAARREGFEINPVSGEEMQKIVSQIIATPKPIAERLSQIIGGVEQNTGHK